MAKPKNTDYSVPGDSGDVVDPGLKTIVPKKSSNRYVKRDKTPAVRSTGSTRISTR